MGMNRETGGPLSGIGHLQQSVADILLTPLGSRVMRREYGSRLFELVSAPQHEGTYMQMRVATAEALERWEPRFRLRRVLIGATGPGRVVIGLWGEYVPTGQIVDLGGIEIAA